MVTEDGKVYLRDKTGNMFRVPEKDAADLVERGVYDEATPEQVAHRKAERNSTALGAAARGVASGVVGGALALPKVATSLGAGALGVEDPLARFSGRQFVEDAAAVGAHLAGGESEVAGRQMREQILADQTASPIASTLGELGGGIAGAGVVGALGKTAGLRLAGGLGLTGRAAQIGSAGTAGAIEGGVLGGEMVHEDAWVRDEKATASQTLAGLGLGAVLGLATGAGLAAYATRKGAAPSLARALGDDAAETGGVLVAAEREGASELEKAASRWKGQEAPRIEEAVDGQFMSPAEEFARKTASDAAGEVREAVAEASTGWRAKAARKLDEEAVEAVARQNQAAVRALSRNAAERRRLGRVLNDLDITGARKTGGVIGRSSGEMLEIAEKIAEQRGREIGEGLRRIDDVIGPIAADEPMGVVRGVVKEIADSANVDSERKVATRLAREVRTWAKKLEVIDPATGTASMRPVGLREVHALRRSVDKLIKYERRNPTPADEGLQTLRAKLEDWIETRIDDAGKNGGADDLVDKYRRTKDEFRAARWAEETLDERLVRDAGNRKLSLTDMIAGGAGAAAGAMGTPLTSLALAGAAAVTNKAFRERGSNTIIAIGRRLLGDVVEPGIAPMSSRRAASTVADVVEGVQSHADDRIRGFLGAKGSASAESRAAGAPKSSAEQIRKGGAEAYRDHASEVVAVATNPEVAAARLEKAVGPGIANASPRLYAAMAAITVRAANYLMANLPAPPMDPNSATPHLDDAPPVGASDLHAYADRVEGVEAPLTLLDDLTNGHVSPEKVEAIRIVHPEMLAFMRDMVMTQLAERTEQLGYAEALLLDMALDANGSIEQSLRPAALAVMANVSVEVAAQGKKARQPTAPKRSTASNALATRSQQIAMR